MKILHFLTSINIGGAEKFCVDLCNVQAQSSEHSVLLCVLDSIGEKQTLVKNISEDVNLISLNKNSAYSLDMIAKIYKLIKKEQPDIIHLNGRSLIYASLAILLSRIPSVYTVHTFADKEYNKYLKSYNRFLFNSFPKLFVPVAISKAVLHTVKKTYGKQFNNLIYNGSSELKNTVDLPTVRGYINRLKVDNSTLVFAYIGRIGPEKNTLLLIESFNSLLEENVNIVLCIIGYDSTQTQKYLPLCQMNNKYPDKIKFLGSKDNIADYLACVDAVCLTSTYEGLSLTALESFSLGIPVISTPSGGPSELIINGVNGYISDIITVESYTDALKLFISEPLKNKNEIQSIYQNKYTMIKCAKEYLEFYKETMKFSNV